MQDVASPVAQAAAAAALAWFIARHVLGHPEPFFAPIAAAVALSTSHVQRARRSVQMVVGVLLGIGIAELLHPLIGSGGFAIGVVVLVALFAAVALGIGFVGEGMMFFNQAAASAVLVIALHRAGTGSERAVDALVGGAVALVIGVGLFPADPLKLLWGAERGVLGALLRVLAQRSQIEAGGSDDGEQGEQEAMAAADPDMGWALSASHEVHARLGALTQARSTARASVRIAPRRIPMRATVEIEERRVAGIYLLASAVLSLMRTTLELDRRGGQIEPACALDLSDLADALRALRDAPRPWPQTTVAEVGGRMYGLLGRELPASSPEAAILTSASRAVAADVLALLPDAAD